MKKNLLITTGGSGGHVIPATIFHKHLSDTSNTIISTDKRGLKYLDNIDSEILIINTPRLNNIFFLPFSLITIIFLTVKSFFLLKKKKINKIISTGGYMSLPIIFAAKLLKLKIYLFEPNLVLGRANKIFLNSSEKIFCYTKKIKNFPDKFKDKIEIINPIVREEAYESNLSIKNKNKFNLLVVGGSQGAGIFDNHLKSLIVEISKKFPIEIFQQTSEKNIASLKKFYSTNSIENTIFNFSENFFNIMRKADLCITRAGASTLAELSALNVPFVAVPLPNSKDNHQLENAIFYKDNNCCWIIEQSFFEEKISQLLEDIIKNKSELIKKKESLKKINYQNTWINVNQKIVRVINEN